jgi:chromosome segregation ATPase
MAGYNRAGFGRPIEVWNAFRERTMVAEADRLEGTTGHVDPTASQIALRDQELTVDVDSLLSGELEPLEFAKELDTQFELILDINKALETDLREAREELRDLKRRNTQVEKLLRQATSDINKGKDLDERLAKARVAYEELLDQIDDTKQQVEREELAIKKKDDKIRRLTEVQDRLKYEAGVLKNRIEGVRAEKGEIDNRLQSVYFDLRDLEEQKKKIEEAIKAVRRRTEATKDNVLKIKRTLSNVLMAFTNTQNKARLQFGKIKPVEQ